ncbi:MULTISPECIES: type VI secretion system-associated FHA domain protein TagH [Pseudomonas]|uniref:type VI secretion system-associated FHA domain protein TagH n=1 Tax=Pseudomonas TaxID=286 RepID=UPI000C880D13|nr:MULTISPECIES: type VI secretion system-associated FHA domain protein TagH [Pseudomonas]MBJ2321668.1 type VI secretion system-associated FHA domain protein TagH [Pseudomonas fluorescens]PMZ67432.1 type VI secretion system-associated FHA domain protein TagH [Pseudomonas sp. GW247-3R2A]MDI3187673.1 type VI secretion system-associated FHA domain protein TagH [Pseudomonas paracarnis]PMY61560.1 type VI secretion system-associated FHA domain protein TagH [Pseudomonas sp. MPR-R3A]PMY95292.1 type VI
MKLQLVFEVCACESDQSLLLARKVFDGTGGVIGRGPGCDWVIPDASRVLSSHHGLIGYREGRYFLTDISRNGIGMAKSPERLRKGQARLISDGDVFELGVLTIRARLLESPRPSDELLAPAAVPIPDDAFLSLDPLHGLDLDRQMRATSDDLEALNKSADEQAVWADHYGADCEHVVLPRRQDPSMEVTAVPAVASTLSTDEVFWSQFAAVLGMDLTALDTPAREALAIKVARLFRVTIEGLQQGLRTREELNNELGMAPFASQGSGQNPLKVYSDTDAALSAMLDTRELGQLPAVRAIAQVHLELQVHQVALLAACRSAMRNARAVFEPSHLLGCFASQGKPARFFSDGGRWRAYQRYYQRVVAQEQLNDRPLAGDFAKAYEEQVRLISSLHIDFPG